MREYEHQNSGHKKQFFNLMLLALVSIWLISCEVTPEPTESYDLSAHEPWAEIKIPGLTIFNNVWGAGDIQDYTQYIFLNKEPTFFGWAWKWPNIGTQVKGYPEIICGYKPWNNSTTLEGFPFKLNTQDVRIQYDFSLSASGTYNASFVIYLTDSATPLPQSITHEIMIWLNTAGMRPAGLPIPSKVVTIADKKISLFVKKQFHVENYVWDFLCFQYQKSISSGEILLSDFLRILMSENLINESSYVSSIEFGSEVVEGKGEMRVKDYNISLLSDKE